MKRALLLVVVFGSLAACGSQGKTASPVPVYPPDAGVDPNAPGLSDASPDNKDELPMAEVEANMGPVREAVQQCAAVTTFEGKVTVKVTIYPDGHATADASTIQGTGAVPAEIAACITDAFAKATFPTSGRGQRFTYGFTF
jgi:hypothetical protein